VRSESLAATFFLIAHDPFDDGRLSLRPEILGCGLVGAELADLVMGRRLGIEDEALIVTRPTGGFTASPAEEIDELDKFVIEAVTSQESVHPVRTWFEPLQEGVYELVCRGLVASGVLRREQSSRRIGRSRQPDRFPANDLLAACRPQLHLPELLNSPKDLTLRAGMLAALMHALGAENRLNVDLGRTKLRELLDEIDQYLPGDLQAICDAVRSVVTEVGVRSM
jgi:hypothetical protein